MIETLASLIAVVHFIGFLAWCLVVLMLLGALVWVAPEEAE